MVLNLKMLQAKKARGLLQSPGIQCALLGLNNFWSDKEDQLRGGCVDQAVFEQVAQERNAAEQWHLCNSYAVLGLDDAANHNRSAVRDQDLRGGLLRVQRRVQLLSGHSAE